VGAAATTNTYFRDAGATNAGSVTHAFDNSNTLGINGSSNPNPPLGDPATAVTGFEAALDSVFVNHEQGKAIRVLAVMGNGGGDYLSANLLPKLHYQDSGDLGGPGGWGGTPLVDWRTDAFQGDSFITIWEPTFTATTDNNWSTAANWAGTFAPNGVEHDAAFNGAGGTITLDLDVTLGTLKFNGSAGYTVDTATAKSITLNAGLGASRIDALANVNVVNPKVTFATDTRINTASGATLTLGATENTAAKAITVAGGGTVNLTGTQTNGSGAILVVDSGTVNISSDGGAAGALNQSVYVNGTVNFSASQHLANLGVNPGGLAALTPGGNKSITTGTVAATGRLDLGDGKLIVKTTPTGTWNGAAYSDVTGLIASGRNGGGWAGNGIVTSQTQAVTSNLTTIGVATASQVKGIAATATATFAGQTVTGSDTLAMYTYGGDANLDGKINVDDYTRIDFNVPLGSSGWYNGDFNYDGKINVDDYTIIDFNVGIQGAQFPTGAGGGLNGLSAVPEPASISILALGATAMLRRRRRH
jgi:hypothetical protein